MPEEKFFIASCEKKFLSSLLTDTGENGTNWPVYSRLGAESSSSLGPEKREENCVDILAKFACGQVSSPRLCRLKAILSENSE